MFIMNYMVLMLCFGLSNCFLKLLINFFVGVIVFCINFIFGLRKFVIIFLMVWVNIFFMVVGGNNYFIFRVRLVKIIGIVRDLRGLVFG